MSYFSPVLSKNERRTSTKLKHQSSRIGNYVYFTPAIAKGAYSQVFVGYHIDQATSETPTYVAIKRINSVSKKKMSMTRIQREIDLLKLLKHPNVVEFHDAFPDIAENIYIVTEYCNYGDLDRFTRKELLDHEEIRDYISQLRDGLYYLLRNNILHRDLKPKNILLQKHPISGQITLKIADFGFAKIFENLEEDSMMETLCGTPMYLSPEMVKNRKYSINSDLWSVGVMIYQLFYHSLPFTKPRNILELIRNLENMKLNFPSEPSVNHDAKDLMISLLHSDPHQRSTWGNFFGTPWLSSLQSTDEDAIFSKNKELENKLKDETNDSFSESYIDPDIDKLDDSGIRSQARKLLQPVQQPIDELELYGHSGKMFGPLNLKDDHFEVRTASSSVPTEIKLMIPAYSMFTSAASHSISPSIRPVISREDPPEISSLTGSEEQLYEKSRAFAFIDEKHSVRPKHQITIKRFVEDRFSGSNSWTKSGEDIAKIFGDVMNISATWLGKNISNLSPFLSRNLK